MIDPALTWEQACQALASDDYETAYGILEAAYDEAARPVRARIALYLVSLSSLYGDSGSEDMRRGLTEARTLDPSVREDPLYLALSAELDARTRGPDAQPPREEARAALSALARYHAACALSLMGLPDDALSVAPPSTELPVHLRWRLRSWQADAEEQLGHSDDAVALYAEAAHLALGTNKAVMLQEQAALLLQGGKTEEAEAALGQARPLYQTPLPEEDVLHLASWHYLQSQLGLAQGDYDAALSSIQEADRLERTQGEPSYGVALVWGQILTSKGEPEEALSYFEQALELAEDEDRPYAQHELGVALLDLDRPVEAREKLEAVLAVPEYPFLAEVLADVAECDYRLGKLPEAQAGAEQALAQGATIPASLVLGSVALDYYHLDEALEHYERVVREAAPGSRDWITAHQMAADVMAQQGFPDPAAAYAHAQQALEHTEVSDDWHGTLQDHLGKAEGMMAAGRGRTLN
jgi:tetratricopeptide (TPR) repeat protein